MKHSILSIIAITAISATAFAQIPNNGFENWTSKGNYENPDNWSTLNNTTATYSLFTATKATPGNTGASYLKLTSKTIGGSVVPGIAVCGKLDTISLQPKSGFAFNQRPAALGGKWQHMIFGSSQGSLMALLTRWNSSTNKRDTVAYGMQGLSSMAMNWASFSFNLSYKDSLHYPDSCVIVLKASGSAPTNNDYLWVDGLAFTGTVALATPPNLLGTNAVANKQIQLNLFPNPATNQITVSYSSNNSERKLFLIFDSNGKVIKEMDIHKGENNLVVDTKEFAKGIYTLSLKDSHEIYTKTFVVQ
jgi:hypothetical protein